MSGGPNPAEVVQGDSQAILGPPRAGTWLPEDIHTRLNDGGRLLADTDWHIRRLYAPLLTGTSGMRAISCRHVIDANRRPEGESLYPAQNTTRLVPVRDFDSEPTGDMLADLAAPATELRA